MKEEIKEILELLAFTDENIMFCDIVKLNSKRSHLLLDYITNLQEAIEIKNQRINEEQQEKERYIKFYNELNIWNKQLQEENTKLKELCDKYEEEHNNAFKLWTMKMEEMPDYEERMNYKSRNEKAIEYINKNWGHWCSNHCKYATETINILKGDNKE